MRIVKNSVFPPVYLGDIRNESNTQRANTYKFLSIRPIQAQAHPQPISIYVQLCFDFIVHFAGDPVLLEAKTINLDVARCIFTKYNRKERFPFYFSIP